LDFLLHRSTDFYPKRRRTPHSKNTDFPMTNPLQPFLDQAGVVILDGALATELERRGANLDDPLWSAKMLLEGPDLIRQIHLDYFMAGADVATTASYQTSFAGFARRGLNQDQAAGLMIRSVQLAQEARDRFWSDLANRKGRIKPLVAASIGCYGACLHDGSEYRGDYGLSIDQLIAFHRPRMQVLAESGADLLACETIPCLIEAEALVRLLPEFGMPAWISFSCMDERHVCHGETLADCLALADACENVVALGINCTPPRLVTGLLASVRGTTRKPLVVYPNRGESWDAQARCWIGETNPLDWGEAARSWYAAGARLIGGCCRTTPDNIRRMAKDLRGHSGS
jgi:homocysteine S-methyltransferase